MANSSVSTQTSVALIPAWSRQRFVELVDESAAEAVANHSEASPEVTFRTWYRWLASVSVGLLASVKNTEATFLKERTKTHKSSTKRGRS